MGAYLSQPILDKETEDGEDEVSGLRWGAAGMQGWRKGMEDSHLACLDLNAAGNGAAGSTGMEVEADPSKKIAAFGVFDGHGGAEVAKYCSAHICDVVRSTEAFKGGDMGLGLKQTFLKLDDMLRTPAGQAELWALKKASKSGDSDSDDGDEEVVDMELLSKIKPGATQMQIMEEMKRAMMDQFRSAGVMENGDGDDDDDDDSEHDDDSKYSSEEEGEDEDDEEAGEADKGDEVEKGAGRKEEKGAAATAAAAAAAPAQAAEATGAGDGDPVALKGKVEGDAAGAGEGERERSKGDLEQPDSTAEEWAEGAAGLDAGVRRRCGFDCGATAVIGLLVGGKTLVVANAGDSRCVVSRKGEAVDMSIDHKPEDDIELARIEKAGGAVIDGRVQGNLNLSRAIGDLMYKADEALPPEEQMITADPDLKTLELTPDDEFVVLACDGVWNSLSSQETIDFVRARLQDSGAKPPLSKTCGDLCDACCADTSDGDGTGLDNVTAVIVQLNTEGARALMQAGGGEYGDMDTSDDGKRKQGGKEEEEGQRRSKKQMKAAEEEAAAAAKAVDKGAGGDQ